MHDFKYRGRKLCCERLDLASIAERVGTPFYCYSQKSLLDHFNKLKRAFRSISPLICFSMKANSNLAVLKLLTRQGAGLDVVSGGELYKARRVGVPARRIVYASVGKTEAEIVYALKEDILLFNVESVPELELIQRLARRLKKRPRVSVRLNVEVDPRTHRYIATGVSTSKFGLDLKSARGLFLNSRHYVPAELVGVHIHIGSQITSGSPYAQALRRVASFVKDLKKRGVHIPWLNVGGGLGIIYHDERPQTAHAFARRVLPLLKTLPARLIMEPGRFIAGPSGVLVTRVTTVKKTPRKTFIIVDGGMSDLLRPSLYGAYHSIWPVRRSSNGPRVECDVVGPICESGDFLARDRKLALPGSGDLLSVLGAGAYGFVMASNYNSRPRPPEVLVNGSRMYVVRRRETYRDLVRGESIPAYLREAGSGKREA
ncbi:MAG: diaminopimelate decarboxylase [Candidatus Omnitrophica bacterium]|nr:diaminopimelate decarboxylase [Candidatus Omnitrophota bacterium]